MEYGGRGGNFVKFENIGDGVAGTFASVGAEPNRFKGTVDVVISINTPERPCQVWSARWITRATASTPPRS